MSFRPSFSRRPSLSHNASYASRASYGQPSTVAFPNQPMTPGMHGQGYPQPAYPMYAPPGTPFQSQVGFNPAYDEGRYDDEYEDDDYEDSYQDQHYQDPHYGDGGYAPTLSRHPSMSMSVPPTPGHRRDSYPYEGGAMVPASLSSRALVPAGPLPQPPFSYMNVPNKLERRRTLSIGQSLGRMDPFGLTSGSFRRPNSIVINFKLKGAFRTGVTLSEAMNNHRLSGSDKYRMRDLGVDHRHKIYLKVRWTGYPTLTYEIPVEGRDGRVHLGTLARRVARACHHFLETNAILVAWDRVKLHHLEEVSVGTWQPVLTTH